jgi:hypothetical protein
MHESSSCCRRSGDADGLAVVEFLQMIGGQDGVGGNAG